MHLQEMCYTKQNTMMTLRTWNAGKIWHRRWSEMHDLQERSRKRNYPRPTMCEEYCDNIIHWRDAINCLELGTDRRRIMCDREWRRWRGRDPCGARSRHATSAGRSYRWPLLRHLFWIPVHPVPVAWNRTTPGLNTTNRSKVLTTYCEINSGLT